VKLIKAYEGPGLTIEMKEDNGVFVLVGTVDGVIKSFGSGSYERIDRLFNEVLEAWRVN